MSPNKIRWAVPQTTPDDQYSASLPPVDEDEAIYGNFNAALSDPGEGRTAVACDRNLEQQQDVEDVREAERRLNDPTDKLKPFKPSF